MITNTAFKLISPKAVAAVTKGFLLSLAPTNVAITAFGASAKGASPSHQLLLQPLLEHQ